MKNINNISRIKPLWLATIGLICFLLFLVMAFSSSVTAPTVDYVISGDTVYIDIAGKGKLSQTPHTLTDFTNYPIVKFTSYYETEQCFDFAFGFDTDVVKPVNVELYKPRYVDVEKSYSCDCESCWLEFFGAENHFKCWETFTSQLCSNETGQCSEVIEDVLLFEHDYETYDSGTETVFWTEEEYQEWLNVNDKFGVLKYDVFEKDTWYYVTGVNFEFGQTKTIRPQINLKPMLGENSGKYSILMKRCSDTIAEAISSGRYVHLDPWWGSSYSYRMNISCSNINDGVPLVINGSDGFFGGNIIWTYCSGTGTALYYNNYTDGFAVANDSQQLPTEVEVGLAANWSASSVWKDYNLTYHMGQEAPEDSSAGGYDGTEVGSNTVTSCKIGNCLEFDGSSNDGVTFDTFIDMEAHDTSVELWLYNDNDYDDDENIIGFRKSRYYNLFSDAIQQLGTCGDNGLSIAAYDGSWDCADIPAEDVSASTWYYVVVTRDTGNNMSIYLNGVYKDNQAQGAITDKNTHNCIGISSGLDAMHWDGKIDEVRVVSKRLSQSEITERYQNFLGTSGYGTLGAEEVNPGGGGGGDGGAIGGTIKTTSGNITIEPAGDWVIVNGSLEVTGSCVNCGSGGSTTEEIQDASWDVLTGTQTHITVTYQDASDEVEFVVSDDWVDEGGDTMTGDLVLGSNKLNLSGDDTYIHSSGSKNIEVHAGSDGYIELDPGDSAQFNIGIYLSGNQSIVPSGGDGYWTIGTSSYKFFSIHAKTSDIGEVVEGYLHNPNFDYSMGDVVCLDTESEFEIKPCELLSDRIIGVVASLPHNQTLNENETVFIEMRIAIYGKFSPVKVKGTIYKGDYLVMSDTLGVATSMYDREHPLFGQLGSSDVKGVYNLYAKMLPTLGIALEDYDSKKVGTIAVVLGK